MTFLRAPLSWVKWGGLTLALACSSVDSGSDEPNGESDDTTPSGGNSPGDGDAAGGDGDGEASGGNGDGDGAGGSGDGGTGGIGDPPGSGGALSDGCRSDGECTSSTGSTSSYCVEPDPSAATLSNITDPQTCQPAFRGWCGLCNCPPSPAICETEDDCGDERPFCTEIHIGTATVLGCSECEADTDCGGSTPRCVLTSSAAYQCRPCAETSDCAEGVCTSEFLCSPACETDADCVDSVSECNNKRCEPRACESNADCPEIATCGAEGTCERLVCANDAACGGAPCVKGRCFEEGGSCRTIFYSF